MNARYSITVALCLAILLGIVLSVPMSEDAVRVSASAPNAKPTPTISKQMNAGRVGNVQAALTPEANKLVPLDGNAQLPASVIPNNFWKKGGNAGTNPASDFIGTTDNVGFELRVNNQRALRVEPGSVGGNFSSNFISGASGNNVTSGVTGATIGGGDNGFVNSVSDHFGTVSGGRANTAGLFDTVGGGVSNTAQGSSSTIGGGESNATTGFAAAIGGGDDNIASGFESTVVGGGDNTASGDHSVVMGGTENVAGGAWSLAAGHRAKLADTADGSFMFADGSSFNFNSNLANAFSARVTGGAKFVVGINGSGDPTWTCSLSNGNSWSCSSDRNLKENFQAVNARGVLEKLVRLPVVKWNAKGQDPRVKHLGPMAQDFYAAFGLGDDDKSISTIDLDGVALVSIQALYEMLEAHDARFETQQREIEALRARNTSFEARLKALEAQK